MNTRSLSNRIMGAMLYSTPTKKLWTWLATYDKFCMSVMGNNFTEDCPQCHCETADVLEYDGDEDAYRMKCDECGLVYCADNDEGVWK